MNTFTKKLSKDQIKQIVNEYKDYIVDNSNQYLQFFAKVNGYSISIYTSDKIVVSGNDVYSFDLVDKLVGTEVDYSYIGSDEVGTGDLFGPLVITAVKLKEGSYEKLRTLGIGDSKKRSDERIEDIYIQLRDYVESKTLIIEPEKYNEMYKKYGNIKKIIAIAHMKTIQELDWKHSNIIIDEFVPKNKFFEYLNLNSTDYKNFNFETKSEDKYFQVAVASIIARYKLVTWFKELNERVPLEIRKGNSYSKEELTKLIQLLGKDNMNKYVKADFKNIKTLL